MQSQDRGEAGNSLLLLRSTLFVCGQVSSTILIALLVLLSFPLPFQQRYRVAQLWTRFNIWWLKLTCNIDHRIEGEEHLPDYAVIVLAKHQSAWETLFLQQYLPPVAWVIKRELLWIPFFGWAFALLRPIAINRKSSRAIRQIISEGTEHLRRGQWVLLFPEGTRTAPGERRRYRSGGAKLAAASGHAVLPIAHNAGEYWPRRGFIKRPGTIRLVIGPIIESKGRTAQEINEQAESWIENTMLKISEHSLASAQPSRVTASE